ncbi:MAG: glutathione S-transferase N-terminal domain-containing protein [Paraglaciecola sp.]|uniref:glutathione S-transferase N-terminal domain-containing protein n=1 Tax=Paraglaciecola sp. TaxID=1920173 RepID=UPI00273DBBE1|nr:glutathione S-transferase N-terminal domain-containing protein [Paraglaciecola sp.]MDP5030422.1 glutathione S-transferase N-terminal domain-containing protein [Paraglaciecola sp.]MDP5131853.1 glutathione S-transferase N-terminal domain-containing protein [Paraglaciecola sp.]
MSFLINLIRNLLGSIIALVDFVTRPSKQKRSLAAQQQVESELKSMALYQFFACPFCIKTRRALHRLNLPIQTRNATKGSDYRVELEQQGGKTQVPCLRITEQGKDIWMYESGEIINYLEQRFGSVV